MTHEGRDAQLQLLAFLLGSKESQARLTDQATLALMYKVQLFSSDLIGQLGL